MQHKAVPVVGLKTAGLPERQFTGWASVFDHVDHQGDTVRRGAFSKSLQSDAVIPICWEHKSDDPRGYVGQVLEAAETDEGLRITGQLDDSDDGHAAYRSIKSRRVTGLSIGYRVRDAVKSASGVTELLDVDLAEISVVSRPANDRALITSTKSADNREHLREQIARAQLESRGSTMSNLDTERDEYLQKARAIVELARELDRPLSDDEAAQVKSHMDAAEQATKSAEQSAKSAGLMAALDDMARTAYADTAERSSGTGHLGLTGAAAKSITDKIVAAMPRNGTKALAAGQQVVSNIVIPGVDIEGRPALSVLDLLPSRTVDSPSFLTLRQTTRNLLAAPVAAGGLKPTSDVGVTSIQNRLRVVAQISSPTDVYLLADSNLGQFIQDEMVWGLRYAIEQQVLNGDGTGENLPGILSTSGIVSQAFTVDILTSVRKSLTTLEANGYQPGAIVLSAADWESLELLSVSKGATDVRGLPVDSVARRLWGYPVALNQSMPAKTGLVIGAGAVIVDTDGKLDVAWSEAVADDFARNQTRCRTELRVSVSVSQPQAIVKVATAA